MNKATLRTLAELARNPHIGPHAQDVLYQAGDTAVRAALGRNPNAAPAIIVRALAADDFDTRRSATGNARIAQAADHIDVDKLGAQAAGLLAANWNTPTGLLTRLVDRYPKLAQSPRLWWHPNADDTIRAHAARAQPRWARLIDLDQTCLMFEHHPQLIGAWATRLPHGLRAAATSTGLTDETARMLLDAGVPPAKTGFWQDLTNNPFHSQPLPGQWGRKHELVRAMFAERDIAACMWQPSQTMKMWLWKHHPDEVLATHRDNARPATPNPILAELAWQHPDVFTLFIDKFDVTPSQRCITMNPAAKRTYWYRFTNLDTAAAVAALGDNPTSWSMLVDMLRAGVDLQGAAVSAELIAA